MDYQTEKIDYAMDHLMIRGPVLENEWTQYQGLAEAFEATNMFTCLGEERQC